MVERIMWIKLGQTIWKIRPNIWLWFIIPFKNSRPTLTGEENKWMMFKFAEGKDGQFKEKSVLILIQRLRKERTITIKEERYILEK